MPRSVLFFIGALFFFRKCAKKTNKMKKSDITFVGFVMRETRLEPTWKQLARSVTEEAACTWHTLYHDDPPVTPSSLHNPPFLSP